MVRYAWEKQTKWQQSLLVLPFLPPTLNEIIKAAKENRFEYSELKKRYTRECALVAMRCGVKQFTGKVWLDFLWQVRTQRRDPADNTIAAAKFILDALVEIKIIRDDSGFVIQRPVTHDWEVAKTEGCKLLISDYPIYRLERVIPPER